MAVPWHLRGSPYAPTDWLDPVGACIDLAYDVAVGVSLADEWLIHAGILGAVFLFIALLHHIGRRPSLRARFTSFPRCARCAYDLTGNLSGVCPECGTPVTPADNLSAREAA